MSYPDSVAYLYSLGNEMKAAKLGLDRIQALLARLGNPHRQFRSIHVAGTNGKGSVCAMIAAGLEAAGHTTGLFTSPHLLQPTERIRINGSEISQAAFVQAFDEVHAAAEAMLAEGQIDAHPSYFETVTAMGFLAFAQGGVEFVVAEVGLGGRLDATNVLLPELCVICPISYDHEAWLGYSLESIAGEKAGILKPGVVALSSEQAPEATGVLHDKASACDVVLRHTNEWHQTGITVHENGVRFQLESALGSWDGALDMRCPLRGAFQAENALTAAAALDLLGLPPSRIVEGVGRVRWRGRLEKAAERPDIYLDGAHNPAACAALAEFIRNVRGDRKVWLVFGLMRDKAVSEMTTLLYPEADELVLTAPRQPRALRPEQLAADTHGKPFQLAEDIDAAMAVVRQVAPEDLVFIAGSLFLVAEAAAILPGETRQNTEPSGPVSA
jgi:dihydrofolate synthase / folylpolyglutamate synthase